MGSRDCVPLIVAPEAINASNIHDRSMDSVERGPVAELGKASSKMDQALTVNLVLDFAFLWKEVRFDVLVDEATLEDTSKTSHALWAKKFFESSKT